eukprot:CAMPEP_0185789216 /NCGR_PEP_ID=MMETSP1174-20130828/149892_1 /TAXON_ID=35687 /ORGANISM="Dictyocha speculum, Strain CCMP1381" /LENGTH=225 /DNA_ID=CAMNT_0028483255 /DNA_START=158 /DNA_END=832 /DNA_ORIENTATION=-
MSQINTPGAFAVIDNTRCIALCPICNHPGTRAGHRSSKAGCVECIQNRTGDSCDAIHAEYHRSRRRTSVGNSEGNDASSSTAENESDVDNESEVIIQPPGLMNSELALEIEEEEDTCIDVTTSLLEEVFKTREGDDECTTIFDEVIDLVDGNDDSEFTVVTVLDDTALEAALDRGAASSQDQDEQQCRNDAIARDVSDSSSLFRAHRDGSYLSWQFEALSRENYS